MLGDAILNAEILSAAARCSDEDVALTTTDTANSACIPREGGSKGEAVRVLGYDRHCRRQVRKRDVSGPAIAVDGDNWRLALAQPRKGAGVHSVG